YSCDPLLHPFPTRRSSDLISRNSPFSGIWENIIHQEGDDLPEETRELMAEYLFPRLRKLCTEQAESALFFMLPAGKTFRTENLRSEEHTSELQSRENLVCR